MGSTPPPVISKAGNLTVFITPPATPSPADTPRSQSAGSPRSEFSTPSATPRAEASPPASPPPSEQSAASPPPVKMVSPPPPVKTVSPPPPVKTVSPPPPVKTVSPPPPVKTVSPPPPVKTVSPPPPVKTVSPPLPAAKLPQPPPVQVPPPQFEKAGARPDGSAFAFFWDAVLRVQEAHASLDEYISNWFGLDQSKYQWALNDYYESTGKEMDLGDAGKPKELSSKMQKV